MNCYFAEFKRLDKFLAENSTLPVADSETIVDLMKYSVIDSNLQKFRNVEINIVDSTTARNESMLKCKNPFNA